MLKIAVHINRAHPGFEVRWIRRLAERGVHVVEVDCFDSNLIARLEDCDALMWHWFQFDPKALLFAKQLVHSLEAAGKVVFPNVASSWHFDDKVGQKYLFESIGAPGVESWVFYDETTALKWIQSADFPLVFKLKGGAGSRNVLLARTFKDAKRLVHRAFGKGFEREDRGALLKDRVRLLKNNMDKRSLKLLVRGVARAFLPTPLEKIFGKEKGYVYFQKFMPGNSFDTRIIVVGSRAFGIRRFNRPGDFRASGSGLISFDCDAIDKRCVQIALETSMKLGAQSMAYDFVFDSSGCPRIVEISYGFVVEVYDQCPGYWNEALEWIPGQFDPQAFMVDDILQSLECRRPRSNGFVSE